MFTKHVASTSMAVVLSAASFYAFCSLLLYDTP